MPAMLVTPGRTVKHARHPVDYASIVPRQRSAPH